jgi:peptidyl-tRNA hydrolase
LYVITREDLTFGQQASQLCHALREFANDHPEIDRDWYNNSNYICLLCVKTENELNELCEKANNLDIPYSNFYEPDLNGELTAICIAPSPLTKKMVSQIKLAFKT